MHWSRFNIFQLGRGDACSLPWLTSAVQERMLILLLSWTGYRKGKGELIWKVSEPMRILLLPWLEGKILLVAADCADLGETFTILYGYKYWNRDITTTYNGQYAYRGRPIFVYGTTCCRYFDFLIFVQEHNFWRTPRQGIYLMVFMVPICNSCLTLDWRKESTINGGDKHSAWTWKESRWERAYAVGICVLALKRHHYTWFTVW